MSQGEQPGYNITHGMESLTIANTDSKESDERFSKYKQAMRTLCAPKDDRNPEQSLVVELALASEILGAPWSEEETSALAEAVTATLQSTPTILRMMERANELDYPDTPSHVEAYGSLFGRLKSGGTAHSILDWTTGQSEEENRECKVHFELTWPEREDVEWPDNQVKIYGLLHGKRVGENAWTATLVEKPKEDLPTEEEKPTEEEWQTEEEWSTDEEMYIE